MIKFENTEVMNVTNALRGMRNPLNSWDRSDTVPSLEREFNIVNIGDNDINLAQRLRQAGTDHRKFLRQIFVCVDITAPLYFWKQFDTYKVGTTANSCSTMHKIHSKEFTIDDFSIKNYMSYSGDDDDDNFIEIIVMWLNDLRNKYIETNDKQYWQAMIELLPSAYNQKRTVTMTYENILNMYNARKNHKLTEWHELCNWAESELDYFYEICLDKERENEY